MQSHKVGRQGGWGRIKEERKGKRRVKGRRDRRREEGKEGEKMDLVRAISGTQRIHFNNNQPRTLLIVRLSV